MTETLPQLQQEVQDDGPSDKSKKQMSKLLSNLSSNNAKIKKQLKHVETTVKHRIDIDCYLGGDSDETKGYPMDFYYNTPRFDVNDPAGYEYLSNNGYVVFKNVLSSQSEINEVKNMMWDWLESIKFDQWPSWWTKKRIQDEINKNPEKYANKKEKKIDRNDVESWKNGQWPTDPSTGIVFGYGVGQCNFSWKIRSNKNVQKAFAGVWGTDDLITSFDGCNFYRPWKYNPEWATQGKWWHVDQNANSETSRGLQSVQGLVPLIDCDETVGGLCVIPKTHFVHDRLCKRIARGTHDFVSIPVDDQLWKEFPDGGVLVRCKAGDLCLWDSRTVHCNTPAMDAPNTAMMMGKTKIERNFVMKQNKESKEDDVTLDETEDKAWDLIRMTIYVCMTPREKAKNSILIERQDAFDNYVTSTHWPHKYIHGRSYSKYVSHSKQIYDGKPFLKLNKEQMKLVGVPRSYSEEAIWQAKYGWQDLVKEISFSDTWLAANVVLGGLVAWRAFKQG